MQLHLLLESMSCYLSGMGRIVISWQGSNDGYVKGYELLMKRVRKDAVFSSLRNNSREIIFRKRGSLSEVYDAVQDSGDSDYIIPLADDEVFVRPYDLINSSASQYFFANDDVHCCALRLGDNLSCQPSSGSNNSPDATGHFDALISTGKPKYLYPRHNKFQGPRIDKHEHLLWDWVENLNVPHWGLPTSVTSHVYRKKDYLTWLEKYGKNNFLLIEGAAKKYLEGIAILPLGLIYLVRVLDFVQMKILKLFGIYEQAIIQILLWKILGRVSMLRNRKVRRIMIAPDVSVCFSFDIDSHHRISTGVSQKNNKEYLDGKIMDHEAIAKIRNNYPIVGYTEAKPMSVYESLSNGRPSQ